MAKLDKAFEVCLPVDPGDPETLEAQLREVPEKPAVYMLATEDDRPVLLASGLAVRGILRRRLGEPIHESDEDEEAGRPRRSKRADLRPLVRKLYLQPTCSPFETDLHYLWLAKQLYPKSYRGLFRTRYCWMVHCDPAAEFPRLVTTAKFTPPAGVRLGPLPDKHAANRLGDLLTDLFDLCRYYQILLQAPQGQACAYKEMGRCPAPCDGTVSMEHYRGQVEAALAFAADRGRAWRAEAEREMAGAAKALDFERAGAIKSQLGRAADIDAPKYRWLMDLQRMDFLVVQPGPSKSELRTFRSFGGRLVAGPPLTRKEPAKGLARWLRLKPHKPDAIAREDEAALLADYLFRSESDRGLFVAFEGQGKEDLAAAVTDAFPPTVRKRKSKAEAEPEPGED